MTCRVDAVHLEQAEGYNAWNEKLLALCDVSAECWARRFVQPLAPELPEGSSEPEAAGPAQDAPPVQEVQQPRLIECWAAAESGPAESATEAVEAPAHVEEAGQQRRKRRRCVEDSVSD